VDSWSRSWENRVGFRIVFRRRNEWGSKQHDEHDSNSEVVDLWCIFFLFVDTGNDLITTLQSMRTPLGRVLHDSTHLTKSAHIARNPLVHHLRRHPNRQFSVSSAQCKGNVLAKYARPVLPHLTSSPSLSTDDIFTTASTEVAGTSFQSVPPRGSDSFGKDGAHQERPVPAMIPIASTVSSPILVASTNAPQRSLNGPRKKEMIVQGVPIPPKPIPPGEEGKSSSPPYALSSYATRLEWKINNIHQSRGMELTIRLLHVRLRSLRLHNLRRRPRNIHGIPLLRSSSPFVGQSTFQRMARGSPDLGRWGGGEEGGSEEG
jgi:hypothetical protein